MTADDTTSAAATDVVHVASTVDSAEVAESIAGECVRRHLAACVKRHGPVRSTYYWDGALTTADEFELVVTTTRELSGAVVDAIVAVHPYDVPEVIVTEVVGGHDAYLDWVRGQVIGHR